MSGLELEHGAKPGMVQIRTRGVALRDDGNRQAREQNPGRYARSREQSQFDGARRAKDPVETSGRGHACTQGSVLSFAVFIAV